VINLTIARPLIKLWNPIVIVFILSAPAGGSDLIIGGFIGRCSSLSSSGPAIPMIIKSGFNPGAIITREDATVYGISMGVDTSFWLYPLLGASLHTAAKGVARNEVAWEKVVIK